MTTEKIEYSEEYISEVSQVCGLMVYNNNFLDYENLKKAEELTPGTLGFDPFVRKIYQEKMLPKCNNAVEFANSILEVCKEVSKINTSAPQLEEVWKDGGPYSEVEGYKVIWKVYALVDEATAKRICQSKQQNFENEVAWKMKYQSGGRDTKLYIHIYNNSKEI